jgi:hypothetical protein
MGEQKTAGAELKNRWLVLHGMLPNL